MPIYRRVPKRGFSNARFARPFDIVNVAALNVFDDGDEIDLEALRRRGILRPRHGRLKVLGEGELEKRLVVVADAFSASAREKIESGGGTAKVVA